MMDLFLLIVKLTKIYDLLRPKYDLLRPKYAIQHMIIADHMLNRIQLKIIVVL